MSEKKTPTARGQELSTDLSLISGEAPPRFDEQVWPANSVLVILGLILAGLIVAYGDFNTHGVAASAERLAASAWVQLGSLVLIVILLLLNATRDASVARVRRIQFSACVGLLVHVGVLIGLHNSDFFFESPIKVKPASKRRPFEIVSLPSDGKRLASALVERGYAGSVQTTNRDEVTAIERMSPQESPVPIEQPAAAELESQPIEVTPQEIPRADASAPRQGQLTSPHLERDLAAGPLPPTEELAEPLAPPSAAENPALDAGTIGGRRPAEMDVGERGAIGFSPEAPEPELPLLGPELSRRPRGEPAAGNTSLARTPERAPANMLDLPPSSAVDSDMISPNPGTSEISGTGLPGTDAPDVGMRRAAGDLANSGMRSSAPAIDRGASELTPRTFANAPTARRADGSGVGPMTPRPASPSAMRRSPILVDRGGGAGVDGPLEELGLGTLAGGAPGSSGSQLSGPPGIEASAGGGGRRSASSNIGQPLGNGPGLGEPGGGTGIGDPVGGGQGAGSPGLGTGFAARGTGRRGNPDAAMNAPARIGRGGFGRSDTVGLPGYIDGEEEGPIPGSLAGSPRGGSDPDGLPEPAPVATSRSTTRPRPLVSIPGTLPGPGEPGGVGASGAGLATNVGTPSPRARLQSENLSGGGGRFILDRSNSGIAIDGRPNPAPSYRQRGRAGRGRIAEGFGGNAESERAVELGLQFLAAHQASDGHWSLHDFASGRPGYANAGQATMEADTAGTGLALLAFLGAGYSHLDDPHRQVVRGGIDYLIRNQKLNGDLFSGGSANVWFYSHGIAAIALCEAYGMTRDEAIRLPAQKSIDFIVASQHPTLGGWRYAPQQSTDTSVSGWQMMALKSGELAGLSVPKSAYDGVSRWLDSAQAPSDPSKYAYRPTSQYAHQREPSRAMTAEALLMRLYLGWDRSTPSLVEGADYLQQNLPQLGRRENPLRDAYYWYYATQVMFQMQGRHWASWNDELRPLLVESQVQEGVLAGSWDPAGPVPDRWGQAGGRLYVTTMHLLMLEVYYRHLPLYQTLSETTPGN